MKHLWKILYSIVVLGVCALCFTWGNTKQTADLENSSDSVEYLEGKILSVQEGHFRVLLKEGGESITFEADPDFLFNPYAKGDIVTLFKMQTESGVVYDVVDYVHTNGLFFFFICFAVLTIAIAKRKGFFSIVSLVVSTGSFYFIFLQGIQAGYSPILACLLFVISITLLTIPLIHGFNRKSGSSLLAINVGFLLSFLISLIFKQVVKLGDVPSEALRNLSFQLPDLAIGEILLVILFMGAVGALIDVAVTISSAIFEAAENGNKPNFQNSYKLGMEVGKDILGSMINTLLLAYLASSIPFFILLTYAKETALGELLNYDFVALEVTRTLIGATSLVILVPLAAVCGSWLLVGKKVGK